MQRRRSFRSHPSGPRGLGTMVPPHSWPSRGQLPPTQLRAAAPGPAPSAAGRSQRRIRARRGPGPGGAGSERAAAAMRSPREPGEPPPQAGQCSSGPGSAGPRLGGGLPAVGRAESAPPCLQPRVGPWRTELTALRGAGMGAGQAGPGCYLWSQRVWRTGTSSVSCGGVRGPWMVTERGPAHNTPPTLTDLLQAGFGGLFFLREAEL